MSSDKVGAVLVVGGGIAGIQSSIDLAESGFKVYLLDNSQSIGGTMAKLDKTFPTNDCAMCILAPKLVGTGRHPNIELITNAGIQKVDGEAGHFKVEVVKRPFYVDASKCTGCGDCARKCPVEAIDEYNEGLDVRSGIFVNYPQAVPLVYAIDRDKCIGCGICKEECKAEAVDYSQKEEIVELNVGSIILAPGFEEFNPRLKEEYGHGLYPNVVASTEFERILSASGPYMGIIMRPSDGEIPRKIAFIQCVGSRDEQVGNNYCSSVCCMYSTKEAIVAKEHNPDLDCRIFFMDMRAFGKGFDDYYTRAQDEYGIKYTRCRTSEVLEVPETKNLLIRYVDEGGEVKEEEFDLVVLAVGLRPPKDAEELKRKFGIKFNKYGFCATETFSPMETSRPGIFVCGAFAGPKDIPETVAQASGAAAKASDIIASERGKLITLKEYPPEKDVRGKEPRIGVFICHCGINIGGVVDVPGVTEYAKTLPNVVYAERNLYMCSQDTQKKIKEVIEKHDLNRVVVASCTPRTHEPLFQETLREAGLNPYLFEFVNIRDQCSWVHMHEHEAATEKAKQLVKMGVAKAGLLEPLQRVPIKLNRSGLVIGGGLSGMTAALDLARQGYEVHLIEREMELGGNARKIHYVLSGEDPQEYLKALIEEVKTNDKIHAYTNTEVVGVEGYVGNFKTVINQGGNKKEIEHGIVIIATGGQEYKPKEYLYGEDDRVITQLELEEKLTSGAVNPSTVVMIQCVGSRNEDQTYCSRICCSHAVKNALKIKEHNPNAQICVLYKDVRTYGFTEDFYQEAMGKGILFIRYDDDHKPMVTREDDKLNVSVIDPILGETIVIRPDLLVLSAAVLPRSDNDRLAELLKIPLSKDGFFLEAHMKLRPVDFSSDGIFLCGLAHSPKSIEECISQSSGAAARACTILAKDTLESEAIIASVNEDICGGCRICEGVCEYDAIRVEEVEAGKFVSKVTEAVCKGCGACGAACPSGAIEMGYFTDQQLLKQIRALAG